MIHLGQVKYKARFSEVKHKPLWSRRRRGEDLRGPRVVGTVSLIIFSGRGQPPPLGQGPGGRKPHMQDGAIIPLHLAFSRRLILAVTFKKDLEILEGSQSQ